MSRPDTDTTRSVSTKAEVYVLGKNEQVVGGEITSISAAPLGRYGLVIQRRRPPVTPENKRPYGEEKLWLYDAKRHTTTLLQRASDDPALRMHKSLKIYWFPKTNRALIECQQLIPLRDSVFTAKLSYGLVDTERKQFRPLTIPFEDPVAHMTIAKVPENDLLLLISSYSKRRPATSTVTFLSPEGRFTPLVFMGGPPNINSLSFEGFLRESQEAIFQDWYEDLDKPDEPGIATWYALRPGEREARLIPSEPKNLFTPYASDLALLKADSSPLALWEESAKLTSEHFLAAETTVLWLKATEPGQDKARAQALVAVAPYPYLAPTSEDEDITSVLLPDLSAVLYLHEGNLYATSLTKKT
jgi:hypothetical protein